MNVIKNIKLSRKLKKLNAIQKTPQVLAMAEANRNRIWTKELREKISITTRLAMANPIVKRKLVKAAKSRIPWNKGIQTGQIPSTAFKKGRICPWKGKRLPLGWRKNLSFSHGGDGTFQKKYYGIGYTKTLKRKIFKRDNFRCRDCGTNRDIICHHIDENKFNNRKRNLVTLCRSCHAKIHNFASRFII